VCVRPETRNGGPLRWHCTPGTEDYPALGRWRSFWLSTVASPTEAGFLPCQTCLPLLVTYICGAKEQAVGVCQMFLLTFVFGTVAGVGLVAIGAIGLALWRKQ
jgi:hypothetical protein